MVQDPGVFEAVTRQMVETMAAEVREIRSRVDGMFWMVGGAVVIDVVLRLVGRG